MTDNKIVTEIALNHRDIVHDDFGAFVVKRPTTKVLGKIDSYRTMCMNRDLQTKQTIVDENGNETKVPAFLTKSSKMKLLKEHDEWTKEDEKMISDAQAEYGKICKEMDDLGFMGINDLMESFRNAHEFLEEKLAASGLLETLADKPLNELKDNIDIIAPNVDSSNRQDFPEVVDSKEYNKRKKKIETALKDMEVVEALQKLDPLYKQYVLYMNGIESQSKLLLLRLREIQLFSDTIEARADFSGRLAKVFYCTYDKDGLAHPWENISKCEDSDPKLIEWLTSQIEKFERLDSGTDGANNERFNFLSPLDGIRESLEDSHVQRTSKTDGELQDQLPESSTDPMDTQES